LKTAEAAAEGAAEAGAGAAEAAEAVAEAAEAEAAEKAAEATDGAPVRKPEGCSVQAAARPSLLGQPLGPVGSLRVGESTGSAPSGPVARERRSGPDPDQARRRAGVPTLRNGEGSTRRRRRRPPGGTPRSRAPSASCLPYPAWSGIGLSVLLPQFGSWEPSTLSLPVRAFNRSFEWCARGWRRRSRGKTNVD
jgi:hypothetical protein